MQKIPRSTPPPKPLLGNPSFDYGSNYKGVALAKKIPRFNGEAGPHFLADFLSQLKII